jgi:hypothetical protein
MLRTVPSRKYVVGPGAGVSRISKFHGFTKNATYPWWRPMPRWCYTHPALCGMAHTLPYRVRDVIASYSMLYPYAAQYSYGAVPIAASPYSSPIIENMAPPPPYDKTAEWEAWWGNLMYEAAKAGMIEPIDGKWEKVRWIKPYYGIQRFYWIPPHLQPEIFQAWAVQKTGITE